MSKKKYYRTIIKLEVLSEDPYEFQDIESTAFDITQGECSGEVSLPVISQELSGKKMAKALQAQGSDPEFFGLDADGNQLKD